MNRFHIINYIKVLGDAMSLRNQRKLWVLGIIYFFIISIIFFIEGSYLAWVNIFASFLYGINVFKVNKELNSEEA